MIHTVSDNTPMQQSLKEFRQQNRERINQEWSQKHPHGIYILQDFHGLHIKHQTAAPVPSYSTRGFEIQVTQEFSDFDIKHYGGLSKCPHRKLPRVRHHINNHFGKNIKRESLKEFLELLRDRGIDEGAVQLFIRCHADQHLVESMDEDLQMHLKRRREELEHFILELSKSHKDAQVDCCVGEKGVWALVPSEDGKSLRTGARNKHGDLDQIKQILIAGMVDGRIPVEHQGSQVMLQFRMMHQVNGWSSKTGKIDHLSISFWQV